MSRFRRISAEPHGRFTIYSQVGFVHHYRPLSADEQALVLAKHWPHLGLNETEDHITPLLALG
jgi:hypothetical protein